MIFEVFKTISTRLNEYLKGKYNTPEEMVIVSTLGQFQGDDANEISNKTVISLLNVERETAMGINYGVSKMSYDRVKYTQPPFHLNLVFVVAAVYNGQQYLQSLKVLSHVYEFFQTQNRFSVSTTEYAGNTGLNIVVDLMNVNFQELTNMWSVMGGNYYPSLVGKIRMITMESEEIDSVKPISKETMIDLTKDE